MQPSRPLNFNGHRLIAVLPNFTGSDEPNGYVIVVANKFTDGEYINARVRSLDDPDWSLGHYYSNMTGCLADAYLRVNGDTLTYEGLKANASVGVLSR